MQGISLLHTYRRKAEGRRDLSLLLNARDLCATGESKGLRPPPNFQSCVVLVMVGFESPSVALASRRVRNLLPSASCLLQSHITAYLF
jgi:hypothetical protein